jgi:osmotically-inducible protein OsmY
MTDREIQEAVLRELDWEPQVTSAGVGVSVQDGVVALSGFVDSYSAKFHAERAAKRVFGVQAVANDLQVKLASGRERPDPDIARAAVQALQQQDTVPHERIQLTVREGRIILEGDVDWKYQSGAAEATARHVIGVRGVTNLIRVTPHVSPIEVKARIEEALRRSAKIDAGQITVETSNSNVILRGSASSWAEREAAERVAWRAPGVTEVVNRISIMA